MHHHDGSNSNNAFVLYSGSLPREAVNRRSQLRREQCNQAPITHASEIDTGYFHCQEHRFFYPYFNYEIVQVQTTDRNASINPSDSFYILNFPIDQLSGNTHLLEKATQLNPRSIALCNPLSLDVLINNYDHILDITLKILHRVDSLTKITLCVDILNEALFSTLRNQSHLREVEILLPPSTLPLDRLTHIGAMLNRANYSLRQVVFFKIPLEIVHSFPASVEGLTSIS
jgi:hypothetical protein